MKKLAVPVIVAALLLVAYLAARSPTPQPGSGGKTPAGPAGQAEQETYVIAARPLNPWPAAASVRLFVEAPGSSGDITFQQPEGRLLSNAERARIEKTLTKITFGGAPRVMPACFIPHHFLRYYDARDRLLGELSICFCCDGAQANPDLLGPLSGRAVDQDIGFQGLAAVFKDMGVQTDIDCF